VFLLPHLGQTMGASASDIARRASKLISQSEHLYSYSGIIFPHTPFFQIGGRIVPLFTPIVKAAMHDRYPISPSARPTSAKVASTRSSCSSVWVAM